jgi:HSP20 family molecular chaperone IbpA
MNIYETEESCVIVCEIAGMKEDDFKVSIEGNDLRIGGDRPEPRLLKRVVYHCYEIKYGPFERNYWVPNVNSGREKAIYQNGYLKVSVPLGEKAPPGSIAWNPSDFYGNVRRISENLNRLFVDFGIQTEWPPSNVYETETSQVICCEIAGMKVKDFHIEAANGELIISGSRPEPPLERSPTFHCMEISSGRFQRRFPILRDVNAKDIQATYKNGFLTVTLPKVKSVRIISVD